MGEVSYKLMQVMILRDCNRDLRAIVDSYKKRADEVDKNHPQLNEILLRLSNEMFQEMGRLREEYQRKLEELNDK